jgi:peptidoglycan/LPS O-acetylase OafA/YrhL
MLSTQPIEHLKYRADIDGMRAVAIILVIIYHAFPSILPSGFIGVDIFFVISGFLITSIIVKDLQEGAFSFSHFYARRIRRIFPALLLVLLVTAILGWLFLFPSEFKLLGKHLLGGSTFVSNFVLWGEAGYFDAGAESKPFLHLWSLGIEEQFYIFFPLLLVFLYRRGKQNILLALGAIAGLSFFANIAYVNSAPVDVFYSPATRIWELLIGSILACSGTFSQKNRFKIFSSLGAINIISAAGLIAVFVAMIFLDRTKSFPGFWALLPVFGAMLLIASGPRAWFNQEILGSKVLVSIGKISYPLYLWHWPLLSFLLIVNKGTPTIAARISIIVIAIVLAILTYILLEKKIRNRTWRYITSFTLSLPMVVLTVAGFVIYQVDLQTRLAKIPYLSAIYNGLNDRDFPKDGASIKGAKQEKVLFIGDSFLQHYYSRLKKISENSDHSYTVVYAGAGGCPPIPDVSRIADPGGCKLLNDRSFEQARQSDVKKVIFGSAWHYFYPIAQQSKSLPYSKFEYAAMVYAEGDIERRGITPNSPAFNSAFLRFETLVGELRALGKEVYIVLPSPISEAFDPRLMIDRVRGGLVDRGGISKKIYSESFSPVINQLTQISRRTNSHLLDPTVNLCPNDFCDAFYDLNPIYNDTGHIRPYFARDHITIFDAVILQ